MFTDPLFSDRSILTMIHGLVLSGAALLGLAAALFHLYAVPHGGAGVARPGRSFAWLTVLIAVALWLAVIAGTYVIFPLYRATPPEGVLDLAQYPRALIMSDANTAWLHSFGMEIKEHVPWIAAMLATAVAFVGVRYRSNLLVDARLRRLTMTVLAICFVLVAGAALLGTLVNKFAPLE